MFNIDDLKNKNYFVAEIDGKKCSTLISFLDQIGIAFKFPDYYGKNINAFWDCINDLSWLEEDNYALTIKNPHFFLQKEDVETGKEIKELLQKVENSWRNVPNFEGEDRFRKKSDFKVLYC